MLRLKISGGLALVAVIGALGVASIALAHPQAAASTTVKVSASEFKFKLSTKTAKHGVTIFKVTLSKGNHKYICTIDSHASFGMKGTFKST